MSFFESCATLQKSPNSLGLGFMCTVEQQFFAIFPSAIISSFVIRIPYPSKHKLSISPFNILIMYLSCVFFICIHYVHSSYLFHWVILYKYSPNVFSKNISLPFTNFVVVLFIFFVSILSCTHVPLDLIIADTPLDLSVTFSLLSFVSVDPVFGKTA